MYFIYVLYSPGADKYYVGYTANVSKRLLDHNTQEYFNTYTSKFRPWKLAAVFSCGTEEKNAIHLERYIKKQKSRKLIEKLISSEFAPTGELAQLVRVQDCLP